LPHPSYEEVVLLTGYPTFGARHLLTHVLMAHPRTLVYAVVRAKFQSAALEHLQQFPLEAQQRVILLEGDVAHIDLGLSGAEYRRLINEVDRIHHCAQISYPGIDRKTAEQVNIGGTREILELASVCSHLKCVIHHSTAYVSGDRRGDILEDELDKDQKFRNVIEESKARGEQLIQSAMHKLPMVVVRPSTVVGDRLTGEVDRLDGPYMVILLMLASPVEIPFPLPLKGTAPLHLVPVDYVSQAAVALGRNPNALGQTFHLVDPQPLSVRQVFELVAHAGGRRSPSSFFPTNLTRWLLHTPGLERYAKSPASFLEQMLTDVHYDARNTHRLLGAEEITCPPVRSYVDKLVSFVAHRMKERADFQNRPKSTETTHPEKD
jgi:thioester reductase-like protein